MTAYLVSPDKNRMLVRAFQDRAAATKAATRNDYVIEHDVDVRWSGRVLTEVYCMMGGSRKRDFTTWGPRELWRCSSCCLG